MDLFPEQHIRQAVDGLRAIAHPLRLQILCHLAQGPKTVGELLTLTDAPQPTLSQHLGKLRMLGLVDCERRAQHMHYRLATPGMIGVIDALRAVYCPEDAPQGGGP